MVDLDRYNGRENFWECFPQFLAIEEFREFRAKDKSSKKEFSSNIMWAIGFCIRRESVMYNLPNKWELATKDVVKKEINWEDYDVIINLFKNVSLTQAERSLIAWEELMLKRDKYLKNTEYYFDEYKTDENGDNVYSKTGNPILLKGTAEQLDKALTTTPKIFLDYGKIRKELQEEKLKRGKANKPLSASDANRI